MRSRTRTLPVIWLRLRIQPWFWLTTRGTVFEALKSSTSLFWASLKSPKTASSGHAPWAVGATAQALNTAALDAEMDPCDAVGIVESLDLRGDALVVCASTWEHATAAK